MNAESDSPQVKTEAVEPEQDSSPGVETVVEEATQDAAPEPSVGQRLRTAREARGMTVVDVAGRLKLSQHQVEDLESDDWNRLKCTTITRGFVRNYARLVELNAAELMAALDRIAKPQSKELSVPTSINVKVPSEHGVERRDYVRVVSGLLVLVVAILVYFFLPSDFMQSTYLAVKERFGGSQSEAPAVAEPERKAAEPAAEPAMAAPSASTETAPATPAAAPGATAPVAVAPTQTAVAAPAVSVAPPPAKASSATGGVKLVFAKPSWVEIKDGSGQVIFSQLSPAGAQREISGQLPFSLIVGNAAGVTLEYKGKPVDLSSRRSKDDVARITLE
ncbi:RodZ domain-containing protein [Propionivibrio dicarboxylicus]|uniref:Cytoskeleton protein RodZ n=1 Tax=Propionivibrio dicarboxylicus TaxID=83767 RepID=A0A1G8MRW3_9RHOO|nr:RodZ domain-containing protein [Propionivibrio dicarboxylicus]SDI70555.1 cytoskeleton protein RodZ [Propionivibrio dicarboxylicus]